MMLEMRMQITRYRAGVFMILIVDLSGFYEKLHARKVCIVATLNKHKNEPHASRHFCMDGTLSLLEKIRKLARLPCGSRIVSENVNIAEAPTWQRRRQQRLPAFPQPICV